LINACVVLTLKIGLLMMSKEITVLGPRPYYGSRDYKRLTHSRNRKATAWEKQVLEKLEKQIDALGLKADQQFTRHLIASDRADFSHDGVSRFVERSTLEQWEKTKAELDGLFYARHVLLNHAEQEAYQKWESE